MEIKPGSGIDKLLFGMKQKDVSAIYGQPDKKFKDEEGNEVWVYNNQKWRLTFYDDEESKLGYIITADAASDIFGNKIIGLETAAAKALLLPKGFKTWETEDFDITENHFNEDHWTILQSEFGNVVKIEIGASIVDDEFVWKF